MVLRFSLGLLYQCLIQFQAEKRNQRTNCVWKNIKETKRAPQAKIGKINKTTLNVQLFFGRREGKEDRLFWVARHQPRYHTSTVNMLANFRTRQITFNFYPTRLPRPSRFSPHFTGPSPFTFTGQQYTVNHLVQTFFFSYLDIFLRLLFLSFIFFGRVNKTTM